MNSSNVSKSVLGSFWEAPGTPRDGFLTICCQNFSRNRQQKTCQKACRKSRATPWATPSATRILNQNQQKNWATLPHAQTLGVRRSRASVLNKILGQQVAVHCLACLRRALQCYCAKPCCTTNVSSIGRAIASNVLVGSS